MLGPILTGALVVAFLGAGAVNMIGRPAMQDRFAGWGYPRWWCRPTGVLEVVAAGLIAFPATRIAGLLLGAAVIAAAFVTILRHRDLSHLAPIGLFVVLLAVTAAYSAHVHI